MKDSQCILAYTSLYINPDGSVRPCCISGPFENPLYWNDFKTINELFNSSQFKDLRKQMAEGYEPSMCDACFKQGNGFKDLINTIWGHKLEDPCLLNNDYSVNQLEYLDVRFTNLCNFKCRMCNVTLSSSWFGDLVELNEQDGKQTSQKILRIDDDPVNKFTNEDLRHIKYINLAGGEPFLSADVFKLVDRFDVEQAKTITVFINTNLSTLYYKSKYIPEAFKKFEHIHISCSCDGYGKIGEYQRTGFNSELFFTNLKVLKAYCLLQPNFHINVDYTITLINVFHIFDFISFILKNEFITLAQMHLHWATSPYYLAVGATSEDFKNKVIFFINEHLEKDELSPSIIEELNRFKQHLSIPSSNIIKGQVKEDIRGYTRKLDILRNLSYKEICPWIEEMF